MGLAMLHSSHSKDDVVSIFQQQIARLDSQTFRLVQEPGSSFSDRPILWEGPHRLDEARAGLRAAMEGRPEIDPGGLVEYGLIGHQRLALLDEDHQQARGRLLEREAGSWSTRRRCPWMKASVEVK